jgi:hypothetical protein
VDRVAKPGNFDEMRGVAEVVEPDFSFMRVDLYPGHGRVYFGELTKFPDAASNPWTRPGTDPLEGAGDRGNRKGGRPSCSLVRPREVSVEGRSARDG